MRGRWLIAAFAIILSLLCIRQLSYTWYTTKVEHEAARLASKPEDEPRILDSLAQHPLDLGIIKYDYTYAKNNEINLGLDLKGGINVILQVSERDLIENLSAKSQNPMLAAALDATDKAQKTNGNVPYVELFFQEFDKIKGGTKYAAPDLFGNKNNADKIAYNASDDQVKEVIRKDIEAKVATAYDVISSRINQFGVVEPVIQRLGDKGDGRILVELPGVSDTDRVKKLLQSTAKLEFWQVVRQDPTVLQYFSSVNTEKYNVKNDKGQSIKSLAEVMQPAGSNASFVVDVKDTAVVNRVMQDKGFVPGLPANIRGYKYSWANKPMDLGKQANDKTAPKLLEFYVLKGKNGSQEPLITGDKVVSASAERNAGSITNEPVVSMQMNQVGAQEWARITDELKPSAVDRNGQGVAIVLDNMVYSAPNIKNQITGGNSQISGNFTLEEAKDLANILQAGSLPASSKIVSAEVVGPSLGQEAINSSLIAFGCAFALVLIWMLFYYSRAGIYANIALIINLLFLLGFLVSLKATLSLPGIAGIILTLVTGMDANILIYERVKEELRKGKSLRQAVDFAYSWKGAFSAIIDANSTSFITALILFFFGKGPVVGFATTFMIGIFTSTFTAIFITRYFVEGRLAKGKSVPFYTSFTAHWLQNIKVDLLKTRKVSYVISIILTVVALISIFTKGFDMGIEFQGGRTYTVRFDKHVDPQQISESLGDVFVLEGEKMMPQVKTYGGQNQVKITTAYKADEDGTNVDDEIKDKLYTGLKSYLPASMSEKDFSEDNASIGLMSSAKVGPTIADDTTRASYIAVSLALVAIFFYLIVMFKRWQFSLSTIIALAHDVIIVLGVFSLLKGIMPFNMEIDQAFIAAILTVIGYSMNDSIIILDRIRENLTVEKKHNLYDIINISTSETLSRTINTSLSTFLIVLIIFAFGGESIKGFMFAKLIGIVIGTFSSIFVASPLLYDFTKKGQMNK
ncbi:protein translocase subunit SecD [Empedobacter brevis]|uniref:protein translocase subunit SecD n=1 Tax=Empedobacter brevis TaxID=247 RepID=UPI00123C97AB|nr:protein translocase subunit SecD [Empedobacter brevis]QES93892.1 protein translocase subunit SecD [Empedobacter brevis]QHC85750.1 preprotein translocase subunit SecD [Empedobacter brevis]